MATPTRSLEPANSPAVAARVPPIAVLSSRWGSAGPTAAERPTEASTGWALLSLFACCAFLPRLFQYGMFVDGVTYATVARNLSAGVGGWWQPHFSETLWPAFHEQPPLALWLQSVLYGGLGDHFVIDRLYSICTGLISAALMVGLWRRLLADEPSRNDAWWPLLLWLTIPRVIWSYQNNLLENTMGVFCLASVYGTVVALRARAFAAPAIAAAASAALAMLTKGVPGLFPLAAPLVAAATLPGVSRRRAWAVTAMLSLGPALVMIVVLAHPPAREYLQTYVETHLWPGVAGHPDTLGAGTLSRPELVRRFARMMIPPTFVVIAAWAVNRDRARRSVNPGRSRGVARFLLFTAVTASLPLLLSGKLRAHYLVPSLAFYALALAASSVAIRPGFAWSRSVRGRKVLRVAIAVTLTGLIVYSLDRWGHVARDRPLLGDIAEIGRMVPDGSVVGMDPRLEHDLRLRAYLHRHHRISLHVGAAEIDYHLGTVEPGVRPPPEYRRVPIAGRSVALYRLLDAARRRQPGEGRSGGLGEDAAEG